MVVSMCIKFNVLSLKIHNNLNLEITPYMVIPFQCITLQTAQT